MPLGVILQNENKVDGMCAIMDELHKYVPKILKHQRSTEDRLYQVLAGGDQVTVVRACSAIRIRTLMAVLDATFPVTFIRNT